MVTCLEDLDLLAYMVMLIVCFVTFPCGILGHVLYLIVSFPDICSLSYLDIVFSPGFEINITMVGFHLNSSCTGFL